jgi:hypothetical protein
VSAPSDGFSPVELARDALGQVHRGLVHVAHGCGIGEDDGVAALLAQFLKHGLGPAHNVLQELGLLGLDVPRVLGEQLLMLGGLAPQQILASAPVLGREAVRLGLLAQGGDLGGALPGQAVLVGHVARQIGLGRLAQARLVDHALRVHEADPLLCQRWQRCEKKGKHYSQEE